MKNFLVAVLLLICLVSFAQSRCGHKCYATGDPHYGTWCGLRYDVYHTQGNLAVFNCPAAKFYAQADMKFGRHWSYRALQQFYAFSVSGNHAIIKRGGVTVINGKRKPWRTSSFKNGVTAWRRGNRFFIKDRYGNQAILHLYLLRERDARRFTTQYFNAWFVRGNLCKRTRVSGLCGWGKSKGHDRRMVNLKWIRRNLIHNLDSRNLFDEKFTTHIDSDHTYKPFRWHNAREKRVCINFCSKKLPKGRRRKDCCIDCSSARGNTKLLKGWGRSVNDLNALKKIGHHNRGGAGMGVLALLNHLKKQVLAAMKTLPRRRNRSRRRLNKSNKDQKKQANIVRKAKAKLRKLSRKRRRAQGRYNAINRTIGRDLAKLRAELRDINHLIAVAKQITIRRAKRLGKLRAKF